MMDSARLGLTHNGSASSLAPSAARWPRALLIVALAVGAVLRVKIAFSDDGIYWPDEVYQSLEPAHRLVFGYGLLAWEFVQGARNWALPGLIAGFFELAKIIGLQRPAQYLGLTRLFLVAISLGCAWGVWALARACGATRWPAAFAAAAYSLCGVSLYFSHRAMSENACALPVILGLWLLIENASRRRRLLGATLLGIAVLFRLQCGLFCVAALGWQLARRRFRQAGETLLVLVVCALLMGWLDHLTWARAPGARFGGWFHSATKYVQFNVVQGGSAGWGMSSRDYYFRTLKSSMPLLFPVTGVAALLAVRRAPLVFVSVFVFALAHSFIPHKELRFLLPILPLFFALAGVGLGSLPAGVPRMTGILLLAGATGFSLARHRKLTFGELGAYPDRRQSSAWDDYGSVNRLLKIAGARPDLCGLRIDVPLAWTGGFSYLHRPVPIGHGRSNYGIVQAGSGLTVVARDGGYELVQLAPQCSGGSPYSWLLP